MSDLFSVIKENQNWSGTRSEFRELISIIEDSDPEQRRLKPKKEHASRLPISDRRIQWFATESIIPKPKGLQYHYEHLVYYWLAILLRNQKKVPFKQLCGLSLDWNIKQAEEILNPKNNKNNFKDMTEYPYNTFPSEAIVEGLQKMGRKEGRALKSTLLRLAITPWCHVTLNENNIADLTPEDADILAGAFRQSLSRIMEER